MADSVFIAVNALLLVAMVASLVFWVRMLHRRFGLPPRNFLESLLPARPRQCPFWNVADTLVMLGTMVIAAQVLLVWMVAQGWIEVRPVVDKIPEAEVAEAEIPPEEVAAEPIAAKDDNSDIESTGETKHSTPTSLVASVAANSIAGILSVAVVLLWLRLFDHDARRKVGLRFELADVWLGLKSSVMILPPVLLISAIAAHFVPYEHPVLESLAALSTPAVFAATFIGTAIVTPVVEELMFRGLLQGGLQGMADRRVEEYEFGTPNACWTPRSFWPVVLSSLVFASMHFGQGAAPIPLFFLSLGLGYLYRQTGCLTAPIVVHVVLNSLTLVAEVAKQQSSFV